MSPFLFFFGYRVLSVAGEHTVALLELLRIHGISPRRVKRAGEGGIRFSVTRYTARKIEALAERGGVPLTVLGEGGIPYLFGALRHRPGMLVGLPLALLLLFGARLFLFDVEITGNESLGREELEAELAAAGLFRGCFLPQVDADAVALRLRLGDDRIAYVAVNLSGTVARVQIKEAALPPPKSSLKPANLVARCDGVITLPLVYAGECLVQEGDVVRAGQLLASGLMDTDNNGIRITRASGQILARTVQVHTVRVDFYHPEKVYTGRVGRELSLLFFSLDRKVLKTTGNIGGSCDIIEEVRWITVGGDKILPVGYAEKRYAEYEEVWVHYTAQEARAAAFRELSAILEAESADRTLLSRTVEVSVDADGITLVCTVIAEEDIAITAEFAPPV